jgi:hypothetical protein
LLQVAGKRTEKLGGDGRIPTWEYPHNQRFGGGDRTPADKNLQ